MKNKFGNEHHSSKAVLQYSKIGEFIKEYGSTRETGRETGINCKNISSCYLGKYGYVFAGGYIWKYKN